MNAIGVLFLHIFFGWTVLNIKYIKTKFQSTVKKKRSTKRGIWKTLVYHHFRKLWLVLKRVLSWWKLPATCFQVRLVDAKDLNFTSLKVFGQDGSDTYGLGCFNSWRIHIFCCKKICWSTKRGLIYIYIVRFFSLLLGYLFLKLVEKSHTNDISNDHAWRVKGFFKVWLRLDW